MLQVKRPRYDELKDTLQVGVANSIGITMSVTECNEILTLIKE